MLTQIYVIHDVKASAYLTPFFLPNDALARRTFSDCANDPEHAFGKHPEDFTLFNLGSFNNETGNMILEPSPVPVCKALDCVIPANSVVDTVLKEVSK